LDDSADLNHLKPVEHLVREWVEFVSIAPDPDRPFTSFQMSGRSE
jgi:hypothetical protein